MLKKHPKHPSNNIEMYKKHLKLSLATTQHSINSSKFHTVRQHSHFLQKTVKSSNLFLLSGVTFAAHSYNTNTQLTAIKTQTQKEIEKLLRVLM